MGLFLTFYSKLDWGPYIISTAKTVSKKIGALILSVKFLSPEIALYLYKSTTICSCKEYCCHTWAGAPSCYLELLDKLQRQICRTVGPSLAPSLEPLAHHQNVASLSLFYRYYFGRCSSELAQLVPLPFSQGRSSVANKEIKLGQTFVSTASTNRAGRGSEGALPPVRVFAGRAFLKIFLGFA